MSYMSFLAAVETKSFFHAAFSFISGKLAVLAQLVGD